MTTDRCRRRCSVLVFAVAGALVCGVSAQTRPAGAAHAVPRTAWGDPDLQGTWPSAPMSETPFERARELGTRAVLTEGEFARQAAEIRAQSEEDLSAGVQGSGSPGVGPPPHWLERGRASRQASLIVDPPDGRLPPMTEDGARRAEQWRRTSSPAYPYAGPEDLIPYDRCITRGVLGSAFPNIYGTGMQILQAPGLVVIRHEMIHEARVVPLDGRPHVSDRVRSYMGDPRGHWEGNTLVVETTNFNGRTGSYGRNGNGNPTSPLLRLVERFTRLAADTLLYEVTVHDPQTWTRSWTVAFPLTRDDGYAMYEYACHEGNYAMVNILRGVRAAEQAPPTGRKP